MNPEMQVIPYVIVGLSQNLSQITPQPGLVPYIYPTHSKVQRQNR